MSDLNPDEIKARHRGHRASYLRLGGCSVNPGNRETPEDRCDAYRLADALAQALSELERLREPYRVRPSSGSMRPMSDPYGRSHDA